MSEESILKEILAELKESGEALKKIRFALEGRKPTPSGGAYPAAPKVTMEKQEDDRWRANPVPEGLKTKPCGRGCGQEIAWVETQWGNRPVESGGYQHQCPNYVPRERPADPPPPPANTPDFDSGSVPF
jgi:hypothetical protein